MSTPPQPQDQNPQTGTGDTGTPGAAPNPPTDQNAQQGAAGGQGEGTGSKAPKFEGEFDPAKAARLVENLRAEVDQEKTKRTALESQFSEFMGKFGSLFGGSDQQAALTPEQLTANAEQSQSQAREAQVKLAVFQTSGKHGADPDALLDSASFVKAVAKLDPTADTFAASVDTAIKNAVEKNARLKASTGAPAVPPKGGVDMSGGGTGKRQLTAAEVTHLSQTDPEALVKAREDGLLKDYLAS